MNRWFPLLLAAALAADVSVPLDSLVAHSISARVLAGVLPPGYWSPSDNVTALCPAGSACVNGIVTDCLPGTFSMGSAASCTPCAAGTYQPTAGATQCRSCAFVAPAGSACGVGASAPSLCASGFACRGGAAPPVACGRGHYAPTAGLARCALCPAGSWVAAAGATACSPCAAPAGSACAPGASSAKGNACRAGTTSAGGSAACVTCPADSWSAAGDAACTACDAGARAPPGSTQAAACVSSASPTAPAPCTPPPPPASASPTATASSTATASASASAKASATSAAAPSSASKPSAAPSVAAFETPTATEAAIASAQSTSSAAPSTSPSSAATIAPPPSSAASTVATTLTPSTAPTVAGTSTVSPSPPPPLSSSPAPPLPPPPTEPVIDTSLLFNNPPSSGGRRSMFATIGRFTAPVQALIIETVAGAIAVPSSAVAILLIAEALAASPPRVVTGYSLTLEIPVSAAAKSPVVLAQVAVSGGSGGGGGSATPTLDAIASALGTVVAVQGVAAMANNAVLVASLGYNSSSQFLASVVPDPSRPTVVVLPRASPTSTPPPARSPTPSTVGAGISGATPSWVIPLAASLGSAGFVAVIACCVVVAIRFQRQGAAARKDAARFAARAEGDHVVRVADGPANVFLELRDASIASAPPLLRLRSLVAPASPWAAAAASAIHRSRTPGRWHAAIQDAPAQGDAHGGAPLDAAASAPRTVAAEEDMWGSTQLGAGGAFSQGAFDDTIYADTELE